MYILCTCKCYLLDISRQLACMKLGRREKYQPIQYCWAGCLGYPVHTCHLPIDIQQIYCSAQTGQHSRLQCSCCPVWALQHICTCILYMYKYMYSVNRSYDTCVHVHVCTCTCTYMYMHQHVHMPVHRPTQADTIPAQTLHKKWSTWQAGWLRPGNPPIRTTSIKSVAGGEGDGGAALATTGARGYGGDVGALLFLEGQWIWRSVCGLVAAL